MGKVQKSESLSIESSEKKKNLKKTKKYKKNDMNETNVASEDGIEKTKSKEKIKKHTENNTKNEVLELNQTNQVQYDIDTNKQSSRKKRATTIIEKAESSGCDTTTSVQLGKNKPAAKNKKIKFTDDGHQEQIAGLKNTECQKPNLKYLQGDEAEVKDEDIDRFCDELEEDDNVQFEDWVKQIEEKLHSNKKKTK